MTNETTIDRVACRCSACGAEKAVKPTSLGNPRPPRGWKRLADNLFCVACWSDRYVVRAVTVPVASPVDLEWTDLRVRLRTAFALATEASNWAVRMLLANDVIRTVGMTKLPPMPPIYLYGRGPEFHRWGELPSGTAATLLMQVEAKWRAKRFDALWRNADRPPAYTYPQPWPVRAQDWRLLEMPDQQGRLAVSVSLPGGRTTLMLRGGREYARQVAGLRHLLANPDLCCELSLVEVPASAGDHRNGDADRDGSGGERWRTRLMCKVVGWFPRSKAAGDAVLPVRSTDDAILEALDEEGGRVWTYHADQARRLHETHMRRLQRRADDRKAERRRPRRDCRAELGSLDGQARRDRHRLQSLCHALSASLVNFARRRRYGAVRYDDADHRFAPQFPWHMLRTMVEQKCRAAGLQFLLLSSSQESA